MDKKQCMAKARTGEPCRAPAGPSGLCYLHANPDRPKTLGQRGGLGNRRSTGIDLQVPDNIGLADLRNLEVHTIRQYVSGELKAHDVKALVQLYNSLCRIIPALDLETRVVALEAGFADQRGKFASQQSLMASPMAKTSASGNDADEAPDFHTNPPSEAGHSERRDAPDETIETNSTESDGEKKP